MNNDLRKGIEVAYRERSANLLFALTGRTGSGCSTAAALLSRPYEELTHSDTGLSDPEKRKYKILTSFAGKQWQPFSIIRVAPIILTFALSEDWQVLEASLKPLRVAGKSLEKFRGILEEVANDSAIKEFLLKVSEHEPSPAVWRLFNTKIQPQIDELRGALGNHYHPVFQQMGDNIRRSGRAASSEINPCSLFALMRRLKTLIDSARAAAHAEESPSRIVIDAVRNPLELMYLRDHYARLYVVAITTDDAARRARLGVTMNAAQIARLDNKEYDGKKHLGDYDGFVSQSIKDCIQKADIFVANPGSPNDKNIQIKRLTRQLIRYVALANRPGLVTPTRDERCMQVAFVAKLNSGCISRQVGAVAGDSNYAINSIGWNDVPKGQVPCLLRDASDLLSGKEDEDFSDYEKQEDKFKNHLKSKFQGMKTFKESTGLPCPFCFKDAYNQLTGEKNQVHTRSLHAEENAFLQLSKRGSVGISGGVLYTTASPCELCSKKAFQLGIREVVFVDPYPGISSSHILASGAKEARPRLRLFEGAVGHAYHSLYEPLMTIKDEQIARILGEGQEELPLT